MKKNVIFRIAAVVLMCALVTACFASSTFAKYTSEATGTQDKATVAKWSIQVGENATEIAVTGTAPTVKFDVFKTITDTAFAEEKDVASTKIAPGTTGSFTIDKIKNNSEVTANIVVKVDDVATNNIPLVFATDNNFENVITLAKDTELLNQNVKIGESVESQTIYWKWDFEANRDAADTELGIAAQTTAPTYDVTLKIVATQVD